jgi:hypothetical protein
MNEFIDINGAVDQCCVARDMTQGQVAIYSGISPSRFSRGMSGESPFSDRERDQILAVIDAVAKLQASADPFPISWSQVHKLKPLIDQQIKGVERRPVAFEVVLVGPALFKRVIGDGRIETTTSYQDCAAFPISITQSKRVANLAAKLLDRMTAQPVRVTSITNEFRPAESFSNKLTDVGFTE